MRLTGSILYAMRLTFNPWIYFMFPKSIHILQKNKCSCSLCLVRLFYPFTLLEPNGHFTLTMDFNVHDSKVCGSFILTDQTQTMKIYYVCLLHICVWACACLCTRTYTYIFCFLIPTVDQSENSWRYYIIYHLFLLAYIAVMATDTTCKFCSRVSGCDSHTYS